MMKVYADSAKGGARQGAAPAGGARGLAQRVGRGIRTAAQNVVNRFRGR
jgi:hypothetical protein